MKLMIVESVTKAKKIAAYLGEGWRVEACGGHVRDLPEAELGGEVGEGFRPTYAILDGKGQIVKRLVKAMRQADSIYLATDPDREGEAIAWHLLALADLPKDKSVFRVAFHAITRDAVREAVTHPRALDVNLIEAQQARRIVDRLVGYLASPVAAKALDGRYSAGRVQSACLRLIVEREAAIAAFVPQPFFTLQVTLMAGEAPLTARLSRIRDEPLPYPTRDRLDQLAVLLRSAWFRVEKTAETERIRAPHLPFTTSTLQQAASGRLDLSPEATMRLAQTLFEAGHITYHRTDSHSVAPEAQTAARAFIQGTYGDTYLPPAPPTYTTKAANAQEAHEAIRPTDVTLSEVEGDVSALYHLIHTRFLASQMAAARWTVTGALIQCGREEGKPYPLAFRAESETLAFDGFLRVYGEQVEEDDTEETRVTLPPLREGQPLAHVLTEVEQHTTRAPARFTQATLIAALEARGIGRPSTYAPMLSVLHSRGYTALHEKRLVPTEDGLKLSTFLSAHFGAVLEADFTAQLEAELDRIAAGDASRLEVLSGFWATFQPALHAAATTAVDAVRARHIPRPLRLVPKEA